MSMSQVAHESVFPGFDDSQAPAPEKPKFAPPAIRLGDYLQSEITTRPLPGNLLDRIADLYWTERDANLAI
jgi:hypothetical protein